ncbi:sensor histidine kinase [Pediococcus claussenii]|uniref:histidine kinase n=1 Tax=Pediococcus claussenii (strain ATCC BAA-344 / DSM 14800 / JCM 18046 / KCTC 3811 / LMG 21948 / P06) TaxID=701521 RepID=G8PAU7_PEDCP|nr:HAMP domain-containing sensor histidine kinase [Pediococcus claussenii]AEV95815.1 histidine kinase-, DNA gyrase B-, and HSP90-like ATPase family protein [Pediococcus claussenii ATCC BAA-344]ANZ69313.1 hypothetical protein AYR57_02900 [Pediococcus claussenii]ANZ71133.1 hypothetical protein AYR58_02915 [Pediococcus claussenii]KRN20422.1 hypothetical protein IV79_GL000477 [Pediococcus claussenii]
MENNINRSQQNRFFISSLVSFALLFAILGLVVLTLFKTVIYNNVDHDLTLNKTMLTQASEAPSINQPDQSQFSTMMPRRFIGANNAPFRTNLLVFNANGKLLNKASLGDRFDLLSNIKLNKKHLNQIQNYYANQGSSFRALLIKVPKSSPNFIYAGKYVLILENTDSERIAVQSFQTVLIIAMLIFWVISILLSYFLSKRNMRPILKSWNQQKEFVYDAAHELRTPLTIIQNKMEYMLTKPNSKIIDESESIATSLSEITRLEQLTNNLLVLARSDSNTNVLKPETINPQTFFRTILEPFRAIALSQNKEFNFQNDLKSELYFDPNQIKELIIILIDNSLKYTDTGDSINIRIKKHKNNWLFSIIDTGTGIKDKNQVFDRFFREEKSRNRKTGGSGLGLSIASVIVKNHHGRIWIEDNQPKGSIVNIEIPLRSVKP